MQDDTYNMIVGQWYNLRHVRNVCNCQENTKNYNSHAVGNAWYVVATLGSNRRCGRGFLVITHSVLTTIYFLCIVCICNARQVVDIATHLDNYVFIRFTLLCVSQVMWRYLSIVCHFFYAQLKLRSMMHNLFGH